MFGSFDTDPLPKRATQVFAHPHHQAHVSQKKKDFDKEQTKLKHALLHSQKDNTSAQVLASVGLTNVEMPRHSSVTFFLMMKHSRRKSSMLKVSPQCLPALFMSMSDYNRDSQDSAAVGEEFRYRKSREFNYEIIKREANFVGAGQDVRHSFPLEHDLINSQDLYVFATNDGDKTVRYNRLDLRLRLMQRRGKVVVSAYEII